LTLTVIATQRGGNQKLTEVDVPIFDWVPSDGFTGAAYKMFNVSGSPDSEDLTVLVDADPADGDISVDIKLTINGYMNPGCGRILVDMKASNGFYFRVEEVEFGKRKCIDRVFCIPNGPDNRVFQCVSSVQRVPEVEVQPICPGGPDIEVLPPCPGGPENCHAGPPLEVFDPGMYERDILTLDLSNVPQSMRRSLSKMVERIKRCR
jgi:hypothetical protein